MVIGLLEGHKRKTECYYNTGCGIMALKAKKSHGLDGITSEILKLGAVALCEPLAFIINYSILTGTYPTNWKVSKVIPLHKKNNGIVFIISS